jgi:porphobilinogen deaminase
MKELIYQITSKPEMLEALKKGELSLLSKKDDEKRKAVLEAVKAKETLSLFKFWL